MKKLMLISIFSILLSASVFAEEKEAGEPDTIFQKFAVWVNGGYKKDVKPIKKVTVFQDTANWVNGPSQEKETAPSAKN